MRNILLITSSPRGRDSHSTRVAEDLVARLRAGHPGAEVTVRDLEHDPLPYLSESFLQALGTPEESRTEEGRAAVALSDRLVAELKAADAVVIASGLINFGVPAKLKSWIDLVSRAGLTFRYTAEGPEGLVTGKKLYLVLAYGGVYSNGPMQAADFQGPYLRWMLGFLGLTDVEEIRVEGSIFGPESLEAALAGARDRIAALA